MPGGELILCDDSNDKIKMLDSSLSVVDSLDMPGHPFQIDVVDSSNVVVATEDKCLVQFAQVLPSLKKGFSFM